MMKGARSNIIDAIGDTPIVQLSPSFTGVTSEIYVKLEYLNPGGSTKDRIGTYMIEQAVKNKKLLPGGTIIEATSGNTGVGIAIYAALHGYRCIFVTNDKQSPEKVDNLKAYGAQVVVCPTDVRPEDPRSYYSVSKKLAETIPNSYYVNQYNNLWNRQTHYKFTAPEIHRQTGGEFDVFMAAVGTGGTISGCAQYFKEHCPHIKIIGVDCHGSIIAHYWKTGEIIEAKTYMLEGIGEDFIPQNYDFEKIDGFEVVGDRESFQMTRKLLSKQAIYCGGSSGAAVQGAIHYAKTLQKPQKILVLLPDSGNRYSSKIFNNHWMAKHGHLDSNIGCTLREMRTRPGKRESAVVVEISATVGQVVELMERNHYPAVVVADQGHILGVVKSDELIGALFERTINLSDNVSTVYSQNFISLDESCTLEEAVGQLRNNKIVLIIAHNQTVDILTEADVLKNFRF